MNTLLFLLERSLFIEDPKDYISLFVALYTNSKEIYLKDLLDKRINKSIFTRYLINYNLDNILNPTYYPSRVHYPVVRWVKILPKNIISSIEIIY